MSGAYGRRAGKALVRNYHGHVPKSVIKTPKPFNNFQVSSKPLKTTSNLAKGAGTVLGVGGLAITGYLHCLETSIELCLIRVLQSLRYMNNSKKNVVIMVLCLFFGACSLFKKGLINHNGQYVPKNPNFKLKNKQGNMIGGIDTLTIYKMVEMYNRAPIAFTF